MSRFSFSEMIPTEVPVDWKTVMVCLFGGFVAFNLVRGVTSYLKPQPPALQSAPENIQLREAEPVSESEEEVEETNEEEDKPEIPETDKPVEFVLDDMEEVPVDEEESNKSRRRRRRKTKKGDDEKKTRRRRKRKDD